MFGRSFFCAVQLAPYQRTTHAYVIGQPGTGKSRAIESWILQDIAAGHGVGVIDPHGDLFQNLLMHLSQAPSVWTRVVIIDPCSDDWVVPFNPLRAISGYSQERLSLFLTDIVSKIWGIDSVSAPRTMWLITNSFLALSKLDLSLADLPNFLLDREFRVSQLNCLPQSNVRFFFEKEFPQTASGAHQWSMPLLNKLGNLIFDPEIRMMIANNSKISFRQILDDGLIMLVNLPKGIIGEATSALLGAFIIAHVQKAALARADSVTRKPYYLYLDEFQNYTTENIKDILSESRKYSLSLTLVHQYLDQLTPSIRSAILNTTGSLMSFRVGYQDARQLAQEIFANHIHSHTTENPGSYFSQNSLPDLAQMSNPIRTSLSDMAARLVNLRFREFWFKRRGQYRPSKHRTFEMKTPARTAELIEAKNEMQKISGEHYGYPRQGIFDAMGKQATIQDERPDEKNDFSFWGM